ncbi:MAG: hypothetical protein PHR06_04820 [Candidatus Cloacimonetes bacterium]|nr:hypothetical protein [Candidatus Cloacimonadota bacterium]
MRYKGVILVLMLMIVSAAWAVPFITLGEIRIPDAYVLPHKMAEISYTSYMSANLNGNDDNEYHHYWAGNINIGLFERLELGFVGTGSEIYLLNVKAKLLNETEYLPAISLGVDNLFSKVPNLKEDDIDIPSSLIDEETTFDDYIRNSVYFVMSKSSLVRGLPFIPYLQSTMHIGIGGRRFQGSVSLSKQLAGLFIGFEAKPADWFSVVAELDGYNFNTGLKLNYRNIMLRTALTRIEELDRRKLKYAFNLVYTLDYFSSDKISRKGIDHARSQVVVPGKQIITRKGDVVSGSPLMDELEAIRERRKRAEQQLDEIRELLKED